MRRFSTPFIFNGHIWHEIPGDFISVGQNDAEEKISTTGCPEFMEFILFSGGIQKIHKNFKVGTEYA